jgi:hypothetical protein
LGTDSIYMARLCHNQRKITMPLCHLHGYISRPFSEKRHQIQRLTVFARRKFGLARMGREVRGQTQLASTSRKNVCDSGNLKASVSNRTGLKFIVDRVANDELW